MIRSALFSFLLSGAAIALFSPIVWAETSFSDAGKGTAESPQDFAFELRGSLFSPDIDSDPALGGATPYRDVFGKKKRWLIGAEFDWQAIRIKHVGTLGPGLGVFYTKMSDFAFRKDPPTERSGDDTSLEILPIYAIAVLRVDALSRELHVPLVPYGKFGLGVGLWRAMNTTGVSRYTDANGTTQKGLGATWGLHAAGGLAFDLNFLDPSAARSFDASMGVNHTYIFAEYTLFWLNGLAQQGALRVGGGAWTFGLAFEF